MSARQVKAFVVSDKGYGHREHRSRRGRSLGSIRSRVDRLGKIHLSLIEEKNSRKIFAATKTYFVNSIISRYYESIYV